MGKKCLRLAAAGFLIGVVMGLLIPFIITSLESGSIRFFSSSLQEKTGSMLASLLIHILVSGLYGSVCMAGTVLYDVESWPLALASGVHCLIIVALFEPISLCLRWTSTLAECLIINVIQIVCYFVIWLILWAYYRAQVRTLNELNEAAFRDGQKPEETHQIE